MREIYTGSNDGIFFQPMFNSRYGQTDCRFAMNFDDSFIVYEQIVVAFGP